MIHPEIRDASLMIEFLMYNRRKCYFKKRGINFVIALMKFTAGFIVEFILIIMIASTDNIEDIIKDFVALGFIIELDNIIINNVKALRIENLLEEINDPSNTELVIEEDPRTIKALFKYACTNCCASSCCAPPMPPSAIA